MIRVSAGTADVLGLKKLSTDAPPTTAYLMAGDKCSRDCAFCPQGRSVPKNSNRLSRITWPDYQVESVLTKISTAVKAGRLQRTCLQLTHGTNALSNAKEFLQHLKNKSTVPVCISAALSHVKEAEALIEAGAERVGIPLDAACPRIYGHTKGGSFDSRLALIIEATAILPGKISTHLIAGLGETEEEMIDIMSLLIKSGVTIGLFAFTPVRGTRLEHASPPPLPSYRRLQAALYLMVNKFTEKDSFTFVDGILTDFGLPAGELCSLLATGQAFRTSGCPGCNRPYYNESPGSTLYNYPRALHAEEKQAVLRELGLLN
ncbi:radical SAM protein [Metallumcola ferriviriculae]|uniref:Radical SAM protein n=1 Tax=Metallumcola ferriviriculae TaxID=3039180 RepID=A0AAU0UJJ2_9FIRM|nr:radical SAM protein [Desulfitibacteraceae bacterium MK1]